MTQGGLSSAQDLLHFMVSAYVRDRDSRAAAANIARLAAKWRWWWQSQRKDFMPTTLYWTFD